ncbi:ABC transporter permease [uncultured Bifidobacterium sp.]|uniref:ABC transporter permease n=1 Tax=uncultured Bifidobacterium sp. TaxID=165187 RepID=UPI0028DD24AD|nr:ABC transporter permease [uncultured Bifidobacterium sp.]
MRVRAVAISLWSHPQGRFGVVVIALWIVVALTSCVWTPVPLTQANGYDAWQGPSLGHPLGTDGTGADVLSWLMAGSRIDLLIVLLTTALAAIEGLLLLGFMAAAGPAASAAMAVMTDALISIPTVLVALILAVPLGAGVAVVVLACGLGYGLNLARVARPRVLLASRSGYVEAARASGGSWARIVLGHVIPNAVPVLAVQLSLSAATAVLAESGLTYLGIGVPTGTPSWGSSLAASVGLVSVHPLTVVWPGLVVTVVVAALNLFGDALGEAVDPVANPLLRRVSSYEVSRSSRGAARKRKEGL